MVYRLRSRAKGRRRIDRGAAHVNDRNSLQHRHFSLCRTVLKCLLTSCASPEGHRTRKRPTPGRGGVGPTTPRGGGGGRRKTREGDPLMTISPCEGRCSSCSGLCDNDNAARPDQPQSNSRSRSFTSACGRANAQSFFCSDISTGPPAIFHAPKPPMMWATGLRPMSCATLVASTERMPPAQKNTNFLSWPKTSLK